jgi:hypothetical protein
MLASISMCSDVGSERLNRNTAPGGDGWLSFVRLVMQEINKCFMGLDKRMEKMIKPKIIFRINQSCWERKKRRIDLKLQEGVFIFL